jgi:hypothetical protein
MLNLLVYTVTAKPQNVHLFIVTRYKKKLGSYRDLT